MSCRLAKGCQEAWSVGGVAVSVEEGKLNLALPAQKVPLFCLSRSPQNISLLCALWGGGGGGIQAASRLKAFKLLNIFFFFF